MATPAAVIPEVPAAAAPGGVPPAGQTMPGQTMPVDPLAGLKDWHLPDPVSWWPPAPGWWVLAGILLVVLLLLGRWWLKRRRRGAPVRAARAELQRLREAADPATDPRDYVAAVSALLRRLALVRYPREEVAGLTGDAWLAFLATTGGGDDFTSGPGRVLVDLPYRGRNGADGDGGVDTDALSRLAQRWILAQRGARA